ncbi:GNAT family N-acetyltransferase [Lysinibacillus sphaericus]|uniref:GNAT family N-acetyltransferase n=1 Tax=Lysinibacillus sphaericus TaxID=1421 RepID=UPI002163739F|nr:GNAT family protein [Lysinibacillus sphaericus]MCS1381569.1 GNAT family N-acetyltransferase [Lysinibacillus sphaericus]
MMIELKTARLRILPLSADNLKLLIENPKKLDLQFSFIESSSSLSMELQQAMEIRLSKLLRDKDNYIWYTNWFIISHSQNCSVGGIMVKGLPNNNGEVIIGYYTLPEYQGNGYMTEALETMKNWLLNQPNVKCVIADTEKDNIASHRVLEKSGAKLYKETAALYYWKFTQK